MIENLERRRTPKQTSPPDETPKDRWASPEDESTIPMRRSHYEDTSPVPDGKVVWVDTAVDWSTKFDKMQAPPQSPSHTDAAIATNESDSESFTAAIITAFQNTEPDTVR